jgi:hypothetical protein
MHEWSGLRAKYQILIATFPINIPIQTLYPKIRTNATTIPEGAHIGEAADLTRERVLDSFPVDT